ncbi:ABC transporter transmembrane region [Musa troglodytarum]|uniref:ABC transporter transmembrane region n=1 Tax=Musa troglodytarum TaxID=320322 RepID=A0A9E7K2S5_9LILI|nr:ABC transporter transmembrane region [Musa troglodytarum]
MGHTLTMIKTIFFLWFALSGWLFRFFILATWVLPFVAPLLIETLANNFAIQKGLQTLLMNAQVRGTTGISSDSGSLREPLLQVQTSKAKHVESQRSSMYGSANLLQLMTFSWLNPLFAMGRRKPLEQNEIPDVDKNSSAEFVSHSFDSCLNNVKERYGLRTSSIYRAIFAFIRKKAAINASFAVVAAGASYVGPSLIVNFVKFLGEERQHGLRSGYVLALTFLGAKVVESVCQRQWNFGAQQLAMCVRSALISHLYKKGLELSSESRQSHTSGEIINYISVDIQRITDLMWHLNIIWMLPVQISLAIYVLHKNLGVGSFAGLAATTVVMACNIPITRAQKRFQSRIMKAKDERMKATAEVLRNMKILKLQAWDIQYLHKLEALRNTEYNWLWTYERVQLISSFIFWGAPMFISAATFGTCILIGIPLTTGRVLSALATFRMLQDPIFTIPDLLSVLAQGKVSADRIAKYLQEDEMKSDVVEIVPRTETEIDVEIDHGIFCWNKDSIYPTLENIQLKVHRGMKVAICGTVGSGKSSLLSCILGELQKLEGKDCLMGALRDKTILYVTHQVEFLPIADLILVRYAEHLPSVLKNITCTVPGRKQVGIVGRTGSGKSTLIQALFRIVEPREGTIQIDDVDICKIGLHDLRSKLSIIPQDPILFEGTVLDKCQLGDLMRQDSKKLDSTVIENGENWSVGQRQLFCLGRALLKRSNILVLDEATASIDSATDAIIQATLRHEFRDCTILIIAHRIHTVIDSHLILVLSEGSIVEYDKPSKLLEREDSSFAKLIKEYSMRSQSIHNPTHIATKTS